MYGTSKTCGYIPDKRREVSLKLDLLLTRDSFELYMRNKRFENEEITLSLEPQDIPAPSFSTVTGRTFEFYFPKVEFDIPKIEKPADSYVKLSLEGKALCSDISSLDDEMTLTIK
jgi:hypothetical protein